MLVLVILVWVFIATPELLLAGVSDSEYRIMEFTTQPRTFTAAGTSIILPLDERLLRQVSEIPRLAAGEFLLRRRFGPNEYALYVGRRSDDARELLSAFRPPAGMSALNLAELKLYIRESTNANMDIANVYFDTNCIYIENAVRVFFHRDQWESLFMLTNQPAYLSITSKPAGAQVYIDGTFRGVTPLYDQVFFTPAAVVLVKLTGYYLLDKCVIADSRPALTEHFILNRMIPAAYGVCIDPDSYSAESRENIEALERRLRVLTTNQDETPEPANHDTAAPMPVEEDLRAQGEFEKSDAYDDMRRRARTHALPRLAPERRTDTLTDGAAAQELELLQGYRAIIDKRQYRRYFTPAGLSLERYDPDREFFPVTLRVDDECFHFSFQGIIAMPIANAPEFKNERECARLKLAYRNRIFRGPDPDSVRIYYEPTGLFLLYKGDEYRLDGTWSFGGTDNTAPQAQREKPRPTAPTPGAS
jgi:hypothetical protein